MFSPGLLQDMNNIVVSNVTVPEEQYFVETEQLSSVLTAPLSDLAVGRTSYKFIGRVLANWIPLDKGWVCYIRELTSYAGKSDTIEQAFEELKLAIHTAFQRLERKRPFEMDEAERANWLQLTSVIDLLHYKMTTPVETRELGEVSFEMISRPCSIRWISGLKYIIDPYRVPAELMSCRPGQWIEAIVKRDPITHRETEIESIRKISFRIPQESEVKTFWQTLPKAELESTEWAW